MVKISHRVIVFPEGPLWVAQALEHDIVASGPTVAKALESLGDVIITYAAMADEFGTPLFHGVAKAHRKHWATYEAGQRSGKILPPNRTSLSRDSEEAESLAVLVG